MFFNHWSSKAPRKGHKSQRTRSRSHNLQDPTPAGQNKSSKVSLQQKSIQHCCIRLWASAWKAITIFSGIWLLSGLVDAICIQLFIYDSKNTLNMDWTINPGAIYMYLICISESCQKNCRTFPSTPPSQGWKMLLSKRRVSPRSTSFVMLSKMRLRLLLGVRVFLPRCYQG